VRTTARVLGSIVLAATALSCGGEPTCDTYIALNSAFAGYRNWPSRYVGNAPLAGHPAGDRTVFINHLPPPGSATYPVGTVIVKEIADHSLPGTPYVELFAMVKRGCDYNMEGARGWEYFHLTLDTYGNPVIRARGIDPSSGDIYETMGGTGCNSCHAAPGREGADYVFTPFLAGDAG
jgi:hypothetical protein